MEIPITLIPVDIYVGHRVQIFEKEARVEKNGDSLKEKEEEKEEKNR